MKLWIAPFDTTDLIRVCRPAYENALSFQLALNEGQVGEIEFERDQEGWRSSFSGVNSAVTVAFGEAIDGSDAQLLCRASVFEVSGDLMASTQTVRARCGPRDVEAALLAFAKANLATTPETEWRLGDDREKSESYVLARSGDLGIDPRTHAVFYSDSIDGGRVVDLTYHVLEDFGISDGAGSFDAPKSVYKATVTADWALSAEGTVNIGGAIGTFSTYDSNPEAIVQGIELEQVTDVASGVNLRLEPSTAVVRTFGGVSGASIPIKDYQANFQTQVRKEKIEEATEEFVPVGFEDNSFKYSFTKKFVWEDLDTEDADEYRDDASEGSNVDDGTFSRPVTLRFGYERLSVSVDRLLAYWSAQKTRSEVMNIELRLQSQAVADDKPDDSSASFTLDQESFAPAGTPFLSGVSYKAGAVVVTGTSRWIATRDFTVAPGAGLDPFSGDWRIDLTLETLDGVFLEEGVPNDTVTELGHEVAQHILLRLRRDARRSLRMRNLTFNIPWSSGASIGVDDSAKITVPWTRTEDREITGKVVALQFTWDGDGKALCQVTMGVVPYTTSGVVGGYRIGDVAYDTSTEEGLADQPFTYFSAIVRALRAGVYSNLVKDVVIANEASMQFQRMTQMALAGGDPAEAPVRYPTYIRIKSRNLLDDASDTKTIEVAGYLLNDKGFMDG